VYSLIVNNTSLSRFIRINAMQAVLLDVLLMCGRGAQSCAILMLCCPSAKPCITISKAVHNNQQSRAQQSAKPCITINKAVHNNQQHCQQLHHTLE
jgi:hypothetical protein